MHRAAFLPWVFLAALAAAPAGATPVTVEISGTWDSVQDDADATDGSITVGGAFVATLTYDDAVSDSNSDPAIGEYDIAAASSDLSFLTGNYSFTPASGLGIAIDDDNLNGEDVVFLFAQMYTTTGPLPPGFSTGGTSFTNPTLTDSSATAHSSDALTDLPWSIGAYDLTSFFFSTQVFGADESKCDPCFLTLSGTITELSVLPEPSTFALVALVGMTIAGTRRSR